MLNRDEIKEMIGADYYGPEWGVVSEDGVQHW